MHASPTTYCGLPPLVVRLTGTGRRFCLLIAAVSITAQPVLAQPAADDAAAISAETRAGLARILADAAVFEPLKAAVIALDGRIVAEHGYRGLTPATSTNIKSASKSVISALVGIAIDKGVLAGTGQPIATLLADDLPDNPDPRLYEITIGNLLSMQAGLERTSGPNYGRWVASGNWVRTPLAGVSRFSVSVVVSMRSNMGTSVISSGAGREKDRSCTTHLLRRSVSEMMKPRSRS